MKIVFRLFFLASLLSACSTNYSFTETPDKPDDPTIPVPVITYRSPFLDYEPQPVIRLQSWKKSNERVQRSEKHKHNSHPSVNPSHSHSE